MTEIRWPVGHEPAGATIYAVNHGSEQCPPERCGDGSYAPAGSTAQMGVDDVLWWIGYAGGLIALLNV